MWRNIAFLLTLGYVCFGKSFAYIGMPSAKVFIGEVTLLCFLLSCPDAVFGRWGRALTRGGSISGIGWAYLMFLQYGLVEFVRGLSIGYDAIVTWQTLIFNIYPLFLFLGIYVGLKDPCFLRTLIRVQSWVSGAYGVAYLAFLYRFDGLVFPGTSVPIIGQTGGASLAILGLLYFEENLVRWPVFIPLMLNAFVMLGLQVRSEWLAFFTGLTLWAVLHSKVKRLAAGMAVVVGLLAVGYLADFSIPAPKSRGGLVSSREIAGRALSVVAPELAAEQSAKSKVYAGTVTWRTRWWREIWDSVNADPTTAVLGHGYGFRLSELVPYIQDETVRTPHNAFMYALGYTGWAGVTVFYAFLGTLFYGLWRVYRVTTQSIGLVLLTGSVAASFFGNLFETPFGAIPLFVMTGVALAPLAEADYGWLISGLYVAGPMRVKSIPSSVVVER